MDALFGSSNNNNKKSYLVALKFWVNWNKKFEWIQQRRYLLYKILCYWTTFIN